jgi:hypothetical protein
MDPSLVVTYFCRRHLRELARQYFEYGLYKVRVVQKRGGISSVRQLVPPLCIVGLITGGVFAILTRRHICYLTIAGPYVVANVCSSIANGSRGEWWMAPILMVAFPVMHFAYGTGFLWGMWRWRGHWPTRWALGS